MIWSAGRASGRRIFEWLGWAGLIALMILYNKLNEFQPFLYRGGILIMAIASALLITGAASPRTWISNLLEAPPLDRFSKLQYLSLALARFHADEQGFNPAIAELCESKRDGNLPYSYEQLEAGNATGITDKP